MCIFLSWLHYKEEDLFINDDSLKTNKGKALIKYLDRYYWEDVVGHGALVKLHKIGNYLGDHIEVTSFKEIIRFPRPILESIDKCKFKEVGMPNYVGDLLTVEVTKAFDKQETKETEEYDYKRSIIVDKNNKSIEALRAVDRVHNAKARVVYENVFSEAQRKKTKKLYELSKSYTGPLIICDERNEYIKKKVIISDKYFRIKNEAAELMKKENRKSDPAKEVDVLMKENNIETKKLHYDYKKKLVHRFWDLFEDKNNRNETWANLSTFLGD